MDFTHKNLCDIAVRWLKRANNNNGPGCQVAVSEVATGWNGEMPDAIGFKTEYGYQGSTVVEVKVSRSDFLADFKKPHRCGEVEALGNWRYYMCPENLIQPDELPEKWGLLHVNSRGHVKHIVSPFPIENWSRYSDHLDSMRFASNTGREMYLMIKLLARLGNVEKYNNELKDARSSVARLVRTIERMEEQNRRIAWRNLESTCRSTESE